MNQWPRLISLLFLLLIYSAFIPCRCVALLFTIPLAFLLICFVVNRFIGSFLASCFIEDFRPLSPFRLLFVLLAFFFFGFFFVFSAIISVTLIRSFAYVSFGFFQMRLQRTVGRTRNVCLKPNSLVHAIDRFQCFQFLPLFFLSFDLFVDFFLISIHDESKKK